MVVFYLEALAAIAVALSVLMAGAWAVQQRTGNSGWVDTIWTFSLGLVGAGSALWPVGGAAPNARQWLVAALVAIWSLRLGAHIAARTAKISDDPRYAAFAKEWGVDSPRKMFIFLQNQGFGSIPLVFAIFVAARFPSDALRLQDYLGALILFIGIAGESLADAQLKRFRENPANKGRVCDVGLWRWSRHPNYFFEWFGWLAYPVIAISPDYPLSYPGAGPRCWRRSSCTGSWSTSPASRRSKRRCCARAASAIATTRRVPACSSPCRRRKERSDEFRFLDYRHRRARAAARHRDPRRDPAAVLAHRHQARQRQCRKRRLLRRRDGRAPHRRIYRRSQRPALRGAAGVLRKGAGTEPEVFVVLLQGAGIDAAGGRGRVAAADRRACRPA